MGWVGRNVVSWLVFVKHHRPAPTPSKIDRMAFAVATCHKCSERFRLLWRIGGKKLPLTTVIRLNCPACAHSFEQVAVKLVVFGAGREQFPKSVVVDRSALVEG